MQAPPAAGALTPMGSPALAYLQTPNQGHFCSCYMGVETELQSMVMGQKY